MFKKGSSIGWLGVFLLAAIMFGALAGPVAAFDVKQIYSRIPVTCGEAMATGDLAAIKDADGLSYEADADAATLRPAIGIIGKGCAIGGQGEVITSGLVSGWTALSEGQPGYLSATPSLVTQSAPAWSQPVGVAVSTTEYLFNFHNYFDSSSLAAVGTLTGASPFVLEGATADAFETTVAVTDPTADNTITLPDTSGTVAMVAGVGAMRSYTLDTDNVVLTTADCGEIHAIATDAKTYTLPATTAGCAVTFINAGAAGNNIVELIPGAGDQVFGTVTLAASVVAIAGAAAEHILNTKVTSIRGDSMTLIGDGADGWYISASTGIWAEATP